jgi:hypothetical protein
MSTQDELLTIEKRFWTEGEDYYRDNVDESCLIAFTGMAGVFSNADIAKTARDNNRWHDVNLNPKGIVEPAPGTAILTYEAHAKRANGEPYAALVSTGYVKRGGAWKMSFHQQTPLTGTGDR